MLPGNLLERCSDLTELLDFFRMLFDNNQIGVTVVKPDGTIIYYNDAQSRLDELDPRDALGRVICDVYSFTPEDSPTMRTLHTGKPIIDGVHYYRTRKGRLVNAANAMYPLWSKGVLLGAICLIQAYSTIDMHMQALADPKTLSAGPQAQKSRQSRYSFASLIGKSKPLQEAAGIARKAAQSASSVMLAGETGVGKEIFAQGIHYDSSRRDGPYTAINCSAMPETLLEGILFGTVKGAFTGAVNKAGLFEVTDKGTLYLDEVDSMPVSLQSKLLRVLQEKRVRRIGEAYEREIDVRIISSVGRNPVELVNTGLLRPDFYYRLGVVKIFIPTLRARMDDLHLLVRHFIQKHSAGLGIPTPLIAPEAMALLYAHSWPGNVRELEHAIEASLALLESGSNLEPAHLRRACPEIDPAAHPDDGTTPWLAYQDQALRRASAANAPVRVGHVSSAAKGVASRREEDTLGSRRQEEPAAPAVEPVPGSGERVRAVGDRPDLLQKTRDMEEDSIRSALGAAAGNLSLAARLLGVSPQLLHYKLKKYSIDRQVYTPRAL